MASNNRRSHISARVPITSSSIGGAKQILPLESPVSYLNDCRSANKLLYQLSNTYKDSRLSRLRD